MSSSSSIIHVPSHPNDSVQYSTSDVNQALNNAYTDPNYGRRTPAQFWQTLQQMPGFIDSYDLTFKRVKDFVQHHPSYVNSKVPLGKPTYFFPLQAPNGAFSKMLVDFMDLNQFEVGPYKYLLLVLDMATRYVAYAFCKSKSQPEFLEKVEDCFREIKKVNGYLPSTFKLMGDKESAWASGRQAKHFFAENQIHTYFIDHDKYLTSPIERFIRNLRSKIQEYEEFHHDKDLNTMDVIKTIIKSYNETTKHSRLRQTPLQAVAQGPHWRETRGIQKQIQKAKAAYQKLGYQTKYKKGDQVRLLLKSDQPQLGQKGGRKFSIQSYTIASRQGHRYQVEGRPHEFFTTTEMIPVQTVNLLSFPPPSIPPSVSETSPQQRRIEVRASKARTRRIQSQFKNKEGLDQPLSTISIPRATRKRKVTDFGPYLN